MRLHAREKKKGKIHWACSKAKKRHAGGRQAATGGRQRAWRLGRAATRPREEEPAGSGKRPEGELGARWRRKSGKGAAGSRGKRPAMGGGRCCREKERENREEEDEDLFINFAKVQGVHCKVKFSCKL
jgi:hypothetical protein